MSRRPPLLALVCALPLVLAGSEAAGAAGARRAVRRACPPPPAEAAGAAGARRAVRRACPPPPAEVFVRGPEALLYARAGDRAVVGCLRQGAARPRLLASVQDPQDPYAEHFAGAWVLAGRTVAWQQLFLPGESCGYEPSCPPQRLDVRAVTLPDGRMRRYRAQRLWALAAGRSGVVAWIDGEDGEGRLVRAAGPRGGAISLDDGEIDRRSLRVRGTTVHWRNDGRARSARVPAGAPDARR